MKIINKSLTYCIKFLIFLTIPLTIAIITTLMK